MIINSVIEKKLLDLPVIFNNYLNLYEYKNPFLEMIEILLML